MLELSGNPQAGFKGALIAGTNGKGSTAAMLAAILGASGKRIGTMPSPHLSSYTERIQVDGTPISEDEFAAAVDELRGRLEELPGELGAPTEFEILTVTALTHLARRCDLLVIEVGMGGRLDATNVLDLGIAVITNVTIDHAQYLGETVEKIAAEKAGIIKPGNRVVTAAEGPALQVVEDRAAAAGAQLWRLGQELSVRTRSRGWQGSEVAVSGPGFSYDHVEVPLVGDHQAANAALAVAAAHALGDATEKAVREGLAETVWPGRLEVIGERPAVVVDGAHNPAALERVVPDMRRLAAGAPLALVVAAMADKDYAAMFERLRGLAPVRTIFTRAASASGRAAAPGDLALHWGPGAEVREPAVLAVREACASVGPNGIVLACGSLYLAGELRHALRA